MAALETAGLWLAVTGYALALLASLRHWRRPQAMLGFAAVAIGLHTAVLALRWARLGHGPFTTMHEVLSSNAWSLALVFSLAAWRVASLRAGAPAAFGVVVLLGAWALASNDAPGHFPATYGTWLLYAHAVLGKLFLGLALAAVALSAVVLERRWRGAADRFATLAPDASLDAQSAWFLRAAFVFHTLMLVAGAVWAQDAWGRYWDWDPLETWAFLTWLVLALALHLRAAARPAPVVNAGMAIAAFVIAFLTFFGVPFVAVAPHQGAI
ncbi:MAG: cytochrome c biogenesis protein CcsA [Burkholderiales bacterium]|nr:MAG: cytochrome c biogenesis protein CcsA [Burkholderiales bacterium]